MTIGRKTGIFGFAVFSLLLFAGRETGTVAIDQYDGEAVGGVAVHAVVRSVDLFDVGSGQHLGRRTLLEDPPFANQN